MHVPVLSKEIIEGLAFAPGQTFLDGTVGSGGHSALVSDLFGGKIKIIGLDLDADAINRAREKLAKYDKSVTLVQESFRNLDKVLADLAIQKVDRVLFDLGMSSEELELSGRGFSFLKDEPLQMTFRNPPINDQLTAADIVNNWSEESIKTIIEAYGEERFARKIAAGIVGSRAKKEISTTAELASVVSKATPGWYHRRKTHEATKTFQALRIAVNNELEALMDGLKKAVMSLSPSGRIAVITFNSLEDRIVKRYFNDLAKSGEGAIAFKKPVVGTKQEIKENPRARSAKLRILIKA